MRLARLLYPQEHTVTQHPKPDLSYKRNIINDFDSAAAIPGENSAASSASPPESRETEDLIFKPAKPPRFPQQFVEEFQLEKPLKDAYFLHNYTNIQHTCNKHTKCPRSWCRY